MRHDSTFRSRTRGLPRSKTLQDVANPINTKGQSSGWPFVSYMDLLCLTELVRCFPLTNARGE
jgi:hypothetical protein